MPMRPRGMRRLVPCAQPCWCRRKWLYLGTTAELEPEEGEFQVPEEGSAGPVIEYQEFVSLNPVKVFNEG